MATTLAQPYSYQASLEAAYRVNWRIEDLMGGDKQLDFSNAFLPDSLAAVTSIPFLNPEEQLILNQIRGNSYLHLLGVVEEFIVPMVMNHIRREGYEDSIATQALLHFAEEESKHIRLFRQFAEAFESGFGSTCGVIGSTTAIAEAVLQHSALGVALMALQIEWMTQRHYLASVQNNAAESLDPQFSRLLRYHWLEEAQHTKLDTLIIERLASQLHQDDIEAGIDDYLAIVHVLDGGLHSQVNLDITSLEQAIGRILTEPETEILRSVQIQSYRWTFLGSGMTHPNFMQTLRGLSEAGASQVAEIAPFFT